VQLAVMAADAVEKIRLLVVKIFFGQELAVKIMQSFSDGIGHRFFPLE
jgi:hypothetical protein